MSAINNGFGIPGCVVSSLIFDVVVDYHFTLMTQGFIELDQLTIDDVRGLAMKVMRESVCLSCKVPKVCVSCGTRSDVN